MNTYKATVHVWFNLQLIEVVAESKWKAIDAIRAIYKAKMMPVKIKDIKIYAIV